MSVSGNDNVVSPTLEPSLPCIVGGMVAVRMERLASTKEPSGDHPAADSGVDEEVITCKRTGSLYKQPVAEQLILPVSKDSVLQQQVSRKSSVDRCDQSSQGSVSPLVSPRDGVTDGIESMSPFYAFLHSKGLGDCCQYFPQEMSLDNFAKLTELELVDLFNIQSSHVREVVMHTIQTLERSDEPSVGHNEDDEVATLHAQSLSRTSTTSTPPRSPSPRKHLQESAEGPSIVTRRLLHRTFSEDVKGRRRRDSMPHSHSSHQLNSLSPSISHSCGYNSDFSNLLKIRNSLLGHSAPNLSSSMKDLSLSRRSSGRSAVSTPKKLSAAHPRCISPQGSLSSSFNRDFSIFASPIDLRPPGSPLPPTLVHNLKKLPSNDSRRSSFASSGYSTTAGSTAAGSIASPTSSMEKVNPFFSGHDHLSADHKERFSSSESNPVIEDESLLLSPIPRPRSRSFSCSGSIFSPTRAMPLDADSTFMMNSLYRERFPKAVTQMEEKLRLFIADNSSPPQADGADGAICFVHKQVVNLAQDCLEKSQTQLLSALYFHELSENLRTLSVDVKLRASTSFVTVDKMIRNLLMIVSRTARLLECLEFDPDEFYCLLEQAEGQAKKTINTSDIPKYIVGKLQLNRDPLEAILPEELSAPDGENVSDADKSIKSMASTDGDYHRKVPEEKDFEYIKQISNGAYGAVWLVRDKYNNQRFAMKKLLKTNLVLRNQVEQVFNERDILIFADNPFVVSLYGSFETKKHLCLVMEYVEGGDCAALIKNMGGPLSLDMARMYFAETVLALEYIHDYGIVHRDLKPDNLLITNEGHIKLTDFGLSKMGIMNLTTNLVEGLLDKESKQFNDRQIFGTPEYIAPEVILRQGYGKPVDWWSMGIILYEFLIGCTPFYGDTPEELFHFVLTAEVEFPDEEEYSLPPDAQELILRLLERDPLKRLGTTGARSVMEHHFLCDIDWDSLLRQKAEFVPHLEGEDDTSYFDLRADRFPQHNDYEEDSDDDDIMLNTFTSCSPRYNKVYQKVQEMKNQQEHEPLSRHSSDSSSVFGGFTQLSCDSGSESPRLAGDKVANTNFSFDKSISNLASSSDFLKSSLKSNTSTPKKAESKDEDVGDAQPALPKRSASRSVSFDSDISSPVSCRADSVSSPMSPPTPASLHGSPAASQHRTLRRSDALDPIAADLLEQKDEEDAFEGLEGIPCTPDSVTSPDSVFPPAPPTPPIQFDVLPPTSSYTPVPVASAQSPLSPVAPAPTARSMSSGSLRSSSSSGASAMSPPPLSTQVPRTSALMTSTVGQSSVSHSPHLVSKAHLQVTSSSDSASSANNSPGSTGSKLSRKTRPLSTSKLQRSEHAGNSLLTKVAEKGGRPRSRTTPSLNFSGGECHRSLPEVSVSASSPSPPNKDPQARSDARHTYHPSLVARSQTNSCPVSVPSPGSSKSMFVKSASATQLSLLIPPPSEDFSPSLPNVLLSPTSSASSRDQSPTRDALRRPPYILKKGRRGYGFFLKAIRVYSGDGHYYHLNHLITSVIEGSAASQAGLRPNFLVTHINNEAVHGLPQPHIVKLIQKHTNMVTLRALPIEETSLKPGVKPPSVLRKAKMLTRKAAVKKKQSFSKVDRRRQRSSSLLKTLSKRNAENLVLPAQDNSGSRLKSPRSPRLPQDWGLSQSFSSSSVSPLSSGSNSPANSFSFNRPGSLHGLSKSLQCIKSPNRRKSVHNIPLSPLARTPSPSPMAMSPTSHAPPSKLAAVGTKTGLSPSTLTLKCGATPLANAPGCIRSRHSSLTKLEISHPDPGKVTSTSDNS